MIDWLWQCIKPCFPCVVCSVAAVMLLQLAVVSQPECMTVVKVFNVCK